jgi:hypothetical protein
MSSRQLRASFFRNDASIPRVTTQAATGVGNTSATGNGTLISLGTSPVTAIGFVWATHTSPTLADNVVTDAGTGQGTFSDSLNGLPTGTQIYYDSYATNSDGTGYGGDQMFTTTGGAVTVFSSTLLLMGVG